MIRWLILSVLLIAVLGSALAVVALKHEGRQLFGALQSAERERDTATVEWSRLQLEQAWLGDASRIEQTASSELGMRAPERVGVIIRSQP